MAQLTVEEMLESLSERVRHYDLARSAGDLLLEDRNRLEVCALVESLLGTHLRESSEWEAAAWVDSVVGITLEVTPGGSVMFSGNAVWYGRGGWFLDPVVATFERSPDLTSIRAYLLQFGDADHGLGAVRYRSDELRLPAWPDRWCFVFQDSL